MYIILICKHIKIKKTRYCKYNYQTSFNSPLYAISSYHHHNHDKIAMEILIWINLFQAFLYISFHLWNWITKAITFFSHNKVHIWDSLFFSINKIIHITYTKCTIYTIYRGTDILNQENLENCIWRLKYDYIGLVFSSALLPLKKEQIK